MVDTRAVVRSALDSFKPHLHRFVIQQMRAVYGNKLTDHEVCLRSEGEPDVQALLSIVLDHWPKVFSRNLQPRDRGLIHELKNARNRWAHEQRFSLDQAYRAVDTVELLLDSMHVTAEQRKIADLKRQIRLHQVDQPAHNSTGTTKRVPASGRTPAMQHPSSPGRRGLELQGKRLRIAPNVLKQGNPRVSDTHGWLAFEILRRADGGTLTFEEYYKRLFNPSNEIMKLAERIRGVPNAYQDLRHIRHDIAQGRIYVEG